MSDLDPILAARRVIADRLIRTPIRRVEGRLFSPRLADINLVFKLETPQRTGSFKIRGVLNKLANLSAEQKCRGVIGMSSGNHAQALAYGAKLEGVPATVVMPTYSIPSKIEATKAHGATIILCEARDLASTYQRHADESGLTPVHPFDDPHIIAGAGTAAIELLEDAPEIDLLLVSVGGGGLLAGMATAARLTRPAIRVIGVEPAGADALSRSLAAGRLVQLDKVDTVADGLAPPFTGRHVLERAQRYVDDVLTVSDTEILRALRAVIERLEVVAEPSAAAGFAALLCRHVKAKPGQTVGLIVSGGNVTSDRLRELLR